MLTMIVLLAFSQNGLESMCQAVGCGHGSNCSPTRSSYLNTPASIVQMRLHATNLARNLNTNSDMIAPAIVSSDPTYRVAAAFASGMSYKPNESLYMLLDDPEPLVSQAAREALTHIAMVQLNRRVDFGPFPNSDPAHRADAANLWRIFYAKNRIPDNSSEKVSPDESVSRKRNPRESSNNLMEVKAVIPPKKPPVRTRQILVETEDDSIPGFKIKRINTVTVPDETN